MTFRIETSKGAYAARQPDYVENHPCGGVFIHNCCPTYYGTKFETRDAAESFIEKCKNWCLVKSVSETPDFSTWNIVEQDL